MNSVIKVENIVTKFGSKIIHNGINLEVKEKEIYAILGESGAGKSVLLKEIIMLLKPTSGNIYIFGKNIKNLSDKELLELKKKWGVLFQFGALFTSLSVENNISIMLREYTNLSKKLISYIVDAKLDMVGLDRSVKQLYPYELSGGMVKRVALARTLSLDPKLLFLDEPTSGLDPVGARAFDELIVNLRDTLDLTIVMITHDLDTIHNIVDELSILADKKVVASGTLKEVLKSNHPFVEKFFKNEYLIKKGVQYV
jgi:phospholipid/cholesterol/gamma-HCH transport system ATP-binding protein